jgi:ketosteroid isomerase-like protein
MKTIFLLFLLSYSVAAYAQIDDETVIRRNIAAFSDAIVHRDTEAIANAYAADASIFPNGFDIIKGTKDIKSYWTPRSGTTTTFHKIYPVEIVVNGSTAYGHGYYEVSGINDGNPFQGVRGKYVIVWKKLDGQWKIYLDIWNRAVSK